MNFSGVLQPKLNNRFRVLFSKDGEQIMQGVSLQVIMFTPPAQYLDQGSDLVHYGIVPEEGGKVLSFVIEDDMIGRAGSEIQAQKDPFDISLEVLDGNETVVETIKYTGCKFKLWQHVYPYDYAGGSNARHTRVQISPPAIVGNAVEEIPGGESLMKVIKAFFENLSINITTPQEGAPGSMQRRVEVSFSDQETTFTPPKTS